MYILINIKYKNIYVHTSSQTLKQNQASESPGGFAKTQIAQAPLLPSTLFLIQQVRPRICSSCWTRSHTWRTIGFHMHACTHKHTERYLMNTAPATWDVLNNILILSLWILDAAIFLLLFQKKKKKTTLSFSNWVDFVCAPSFTKPARTFVIFFIVIN